ncbi:hypothetical protein AKJ09_03761 [Labilithrix luteola]|uniref:Uncharacterized protein n=1 Tax=Labilithrix luteola TaxID=1391654 RepID=A0A0K1PU99_9BACT|nr:hypothetical protein [Labilithrix luteola]AKU97097.1 hypothetical protein AKJ09_03761 [Labilithrix luteola]
MLFRNPAVFASSLIVLGTLGVLGVSGGACSPFGAEDGEDIETLPATNADASSVDAGPLPDAGVDADTDATADAGACAATFCEGFDDDAWGKAWFLMDQNTLTTANDFHLSPPRSLELKLPLLANSDGPGKSWLKKDFKDVSHLKASVWMKILQMGDGSVDLFGIVTQDQVNAKPIALVYDGSRFILEAPASGNAAPNEQVTVGLPPIPLNDWTKIEVEVDLTTREIALRVNDGSTPSMTITKQWEVGRLPLAVELGAAWTSPTIQKPWIIHFDDVEVTATP